MSSLIQSPEDELELCRREMYQLAEDLETLRPWASDPSVMRAWDLARRKFYVACDRYSAALGQGEVS